MTMEEQVIRCYICECEILSTRFSGRCRECDTEIEESRETEKMVDVWEAKEARRKQLELEHLIGGR